MQQQQLLPDPHAQMATEKGMSPLSRQGDATSHTDSVANMNLNSSATARSNIKVKPRLRAEGLMAPPASDAATLRRQVAALQADVEAHIEAEQRLQGFNQQLSERLEIYMKQNHENLERAATEMNTLHQDMEQTLELQRRLSKRASVLEGEKKELEQALQNYMHLFGAERASLQQQVAELTVDLRERANADAEANVLQTELEKTQDMNAKLQQLLEKNHAEAAELKLKIEECSNKLQSLLAEEKRNEELEKRYCRSLLKRCFARFLKGLGEQNSTRFSKKIADGFYRLACCRKGLEALRLATRRSQRLRLAKTSQTEAFLRDFWSEWRFITDLEQKHASMLNQHRHAELLKSFYGWKNLVHAFQNQCGKYADVAAKHWREGLLKRAWDHWVLWVSGHSKPEKVKVQEALMHLRDTTLTMALAAWKGVVLNKWTKRTKMQRLIAQRRLWCIREAFNQLLENLKMKNAKRSLEDRAISFRRGHCCNSVLRCWNKYVKARRKVAASNAVAYNHYKKGLKRKELTMWKQNAEFLKAEAKAALGFNHALTKTALGFWLDYHVLQSIKKKRDRKAIVHRQRTESKVLRRIMRTWWEEMVWTRHATEMQYSLSSWWQSILLRTAFHSWMHATFQNALITSSKCQSDLMEAKEKCDYQRQRTTVVDVENLHLIDRLHMMSSEIAYLMTRISDKSKRQEDLQHALEDAALIESSMRGDLEQKRARIIELEKEAILLQKSLQKKNSEDVAGEVYHALHVQSLEQALRNIQAQLSHKSSQVESYEKVLKDTADKLEGASDESHQKLSSAFQIAASLRKLLEDRENQYAVLEGSCRRRDLELEEIQKKLTLSKSAYIDTLDARDSRISELEKLLYQKQAQIEEVHQDVQDVRLAINIQDGCYKKLEYEMRLGFGGAEQWQGMPLREQQTCESWLA